MREKEQKEKKQKSISDYKISHLCMQLTFLNYLCIFVVLDFG